MKFNFRQLQARTLRGMSYVARSLIGLMSFVFFLISLSSLWGWPVARSAVAFAMLAGFFFTMSRKELGGHLAWATKASKLSVDTKLLGVEVLISTAVNGVLILTKLSGIAVAH